MVLIQELLALNNLWNTRKKIGIPKYFQGRYDEMRDYLSQLP